jgi:hypothetical protein
MNLSILNNKNWIFSGWEIQYNILPIFTLGGEIYYHSASDTAGETTTVFNVGGTLNASPKTHFILSKGHSIPKDNFLGCYVGLLWTI